MKSRWFFWLIISGIFLVIVGNGLKPFSTLVLAQESDPTNNKFGMHVVQPSDDDLRQIAELVNSTGGDWGYVTLVLQENDRDKEKWQSLFDRLRQLHLIPLVRLATQPEGEFWRRPKKEEAEGWVEFLNSLNWVVKNRYIILFNESNHAREWGGGVDPVDYAEVAGAFLTALKNKSPDFWVMLAGFDAAAPSKPPQYEDEAIFLKQILNSQFLNFNSLDGWVSHSYPNHGFVGTPYDIGRNSIRTYQWELALLKELGLVKDLPVFITETGWPHNQYQISNLKYQKSSKSNFTEFYSPEKVAEYMKMAYENVWLPDKRVMAVTPFIFNYQGKPFEQFAWKLPNGEGFYPQYYRVQALSKPKGGPAQDHTATLTASLSKELLIDSTYHFSLEIKNQGQAILDKKDGYRLVIINNQMPPPLEYFFSDFVDLVPFASQNLDFSVKTEDVKGAFQLSVGLFKDQQIISKLFTWEFALTGPPSLQFGVRLFPKQMANVDDLEIQIFDEREQLVYQKKPLRLKDGYGWVEKVTNVALGKKYRVVVLKPYYLPRQEFIVFKKDNNQIVFEKLLPVDFNQDGKLSFADVGGLFQQPSLVKLWGIR